jgi:transcriptional regulator with XRE-family HTH domain
MGGDESAIDRKAATVAAELGALIRSRRKALKMRQDQLALATGVGRRFLIELEAGKPSCQLGRSLLVAQALGITFPGLAPSLATAGSAQDGEGPELPEVAELPEVMGESDGRAADLF